MPKVKITYDIGDGSFKLVGDLKREAVISLIETFLRDQIGAGEDIRIANEQEIYYISLAIDLSDDTITVVDDTGNYGLRDGILLDVITQLSTKEEQNERA